MWGGGGGFATANHGPTAAVVCVCVAGGFPERRLRADGRKCSAVLSQSEHHHPASSSSPSSSSRCGRPRRRRPPLTSTPSRPHQRRYSVRVPKAGTIRDVRTAVVRLVNRDPTPVGDEEEEEEGVSESGGAGESESGGVQGGAAGAGAGAGAAGSGPGAAGAGVAQRPAVPDGMPDIEVREKGEGEGGGRPPPTCPPAKWANYPPHPTTGPTTPHPTGQPPTPPPSPPPQRPRSGGHPLAPYLFARVAGTEDSASERERDSFYLRARPRHDLAGGRGRGGSGGGGSSRGRGGGGRERDGRGARPGGGRGWRREGGGGCGTGWG